MELEDIVNDEMLTTEDVNNMLEHTDKGRTKQTIRNCVTVLQNDPVLKKRLNEMSFPEEWTLQKRYPGSEEITALRLQIRMNTI